MGLHRSATRARQRGLSFIGVIFVGLIAVAAFAIGGQSVPVFLEYANIKKAAAKAARDGNTVPEIRAAFDRAAQIDDIHSISGKDLEITKQGDKVVVEFAYDKEIPLAGPAYLLLKYRGSSAGGYN